MDPSAADSDPLSYRHDGSSPLPLGLEWSPGPVRVGGEESVWLGVPADAWCFSVSIPAWVTVTPNVSHPSGPPGAAAAAAAMGPIDPFARASPVVLYRVVVTVRSPRGGTTGVRLLRRFSDFLTLHRALAAAFPSRRIPDPPPKHRLLFVSSNNTLISQRRLALQAWLTSLLEDLDLSRSPPVAAFLELPEAARLAALRLEAESEPAHERDPRHTEENSTNNAANSTNSLTASGDRMGGEGSLLEGHRALPGGAGDGAQLSSELLEAYLAQRKGVGIPADCQSVGESSGLPSPSPPSSFHRVLSASSLASLALPPGAEADAAAHEEEGRAQVGPGAEALAGAGTRVDGVAGAERDEKASSLGPPSEGRDSGLIGRSGTGASERRGRQGEERAPAENAVGATGGQAASTAGHTLQHGQAAHASRSPALSATGTPPSDPLSSNAAPPPQLPPHLPAQLQGVHVSSQQGEGEDPLLVVRGDARPAVRRQLAVLHRRLQVAQADMAALVERLQQEAAVSEFLTQKVKDVEAELDSERRGSGAAVAQAVAEREERLVAVEWELEEERGKLADALAAIASHQEREHGLEARLAVLAQRLQEAEGAKPEQRAQGRAQRGAEGGPQAEETEALVGRAREEGRAEGREEAEGRAREEGERARGEVRALAKEVKSLRRALAVAQGEAARQGQQAEAYRRLLDAEQRVSGERRRRKERTVHEIDVLAQRLRETAVTALGREAAVISAAGPAGTPPAGMPTAGVPGGDGAGKASAADDLAVLAENLELLATSDSRIELILAEALLLKELPEMSQPGCTLQEAMEGEALLQQQGSSSTNGHGGTGPQPGAASLQNGAIKDSEKLSASLDRLGVSSGAEAPSAEESVAQVKKMLGEEESSDRELLFSAVGLLVEMAQQRRSINALLRHAYASKMQ